MKTKVEFYEKLLSDLEDLKVLNELGIEEQDESVMSEVKNELERLRDSYNKLKLETLRSGPYDRNNAIMTLHAGAGGTEAQDWVQMLLRMYTRWAEDHQYEVKTLDYLDGDEPGSKA